MTACRLCGETAEDGAILCDRCTAHFRDYCYRNAWHGDRGTKLVVRHGNGFTHLLVHWLVFLITTEPARLGVDAAVCRSWRAVERMAA